METQENIKFILKLFNSNKLTEAKKEIDKQIIKFPNSHVLYNILGSRRHLGEFCKRLHLSSS